MATPKSSVKIHFPYHPRKSARPSTAGSLTSPITATICTPPSAKSRDICRPGSTCAPGCSPVEDQQDLGSCTANALGRSLGVPDEEGQG